MTAPDISTTDGPAGTPASTVVDAPAEATCSVCPHPWADHDALGVRFCTATMSASLTRGCICR